MATGRVRTGRLNGVFATRRAHYGELSHHTETARVVQTIPEGAGLDSGWTPRRHRLPGKRLKQVRGFDRQLVPNALTGSQFNRHCVQLTLTRFSKLGLICRFRFFVFWNCRERLTAYVYPLDAESHQHGAGENQ